MTLMMAITATTSIVTKAMGNATASAVHVPSATVPSATVCVGSCGTSTLSIIQYNYIGYEMMSCLVLC